MDSVSGHGGARQPRSGGKILRPRRSSAAAARTPYDRPPPRSRNLPEQNPSWISRLVFSPARAIASGAGKFISSVVFSDSSSSSSSSSDADSASDVDADEENNADYPEDETMEENGALQMNMDLVHGQQPIMQRTSSKHVIEQLLMQETFGREECDRLMEVIKARVVDRPTVPATEEGRYSGLPNNGFTSDMSAPDMSSKAVMEARKWLEEKKLGSSSKYKPGLGSPLLDSSVLPHVTENDAGSPVDMAKSYMRARPAWASPSVNQASFRSPSPAGTQLLKDDTPFSYNAGHLSSSKLKKGSRSSQSWNIQEEIRKVRAKATVEMLRTASSPKTVISSEPRHGVNILATDMLKGNAKEMFRPSANTVDGSLNTDGRASSCQAVQNMQDRSPIEALPNLAISTSEHNQTAEANLVDEETRGLRTISCVADGSEETLEGVKSSEDMNSAPKSGTGAADIEGKDGDNTQPCAMTGGTTHVVLALGASSDSTGNLCIPKDVSETDPLTSKEAGERGTPPVSNGFPSSAPSSPMMVDGQPEPKVPDEENNRVSSPQDEPKANPGSEDRCQAMTETVADILVGNGSTNENDSASSGSQNSSSTREEWLPDNQSLPNSGSSSPGATTKVLAYSRRGRGRGRGRGRSRGRGRAK